MFKTEKAPRSPGNKYSPNGLSDDYMDFDDKGRRQRSRRRHSDLRAEKRETRRAARALRHEVGDTAKEVAGIGIDAFLPVQLPG